MESLHPLGKVLNQNYRLQEVLGKGGSGTTYAAQHLATNQLVALKILSLNHLQDWKQLELFEREAQVLENLNHLHIPNYIEYFAVEDSFCIVQELAPGKSLAELVRSGKRFKEAEVKDIATQILETLIYLHSQKPPVIHRDIKPENIILDRTGKVFLVDFGAVQNTYHSTLARGSTVVGTFGYMAPEQFMGQAVPATDLYGLGATLLFLLTHRSPAELPTEELKIDVSACTQVSEHLTEWLEKMVEPDVADRFSSAKQALSGLRKKRKLVSNSKTNWEALVTVAAIIVAASWVIVQLPFYLTAKFGLFPQGVHRAVKNGDIQEVEKYFKAGVDPNLAIVSDGTTLLHEAVLQGHQDIVKMLIDLGANVNAINEYRETPIAYAAKEANWEIVKILMSHGANVDYLDQSGISLLHYAAEQGNKEIAKILITKGANVSAGDYENAMTPLHYAAERGDREIVEMLLAHDAEVNIVNSQGRTPLINAMEKDEQEIMKVLIAHGADINPVDEQSRNSALHKVTAEGNQKLVEMLIAYGADVNAVNNYRETPLHYAANRGAGKVIVEFLITKGANINAVNENKLTPLHYALNSHDWEVVKVLIAKGAHVDVNSMGNKLFRKLAENGNREIIEIFMTKGIDINEANRSGYRLLHKAARKGNQEVVEFLITKGANINAVNGKGRTPLEEAARKGNQEVVEFLITKGADINAVDHYGNRALRYAKWNNHPEIVELLKSHGAKE